MNFFGKKSCIAKKRQSVLICEAVLFFCILEQFFHSQLTFDFYRQDDFCIVRDHIFGVLISSSERFLHRLWVHWHFLFLSSERSWNVSVAFFEDFVCFLDNIQPTFLYIGKKLYEKIKVKKCLGFFCLIVFFMHFKNLTWWILSRLYAMCIFVAYSTCSLLMIYISHQISIFSWITRNHLKTI